MTDENTHSSWADARYEGPLGEIAINLYSLSGSGTVGVDTENALIEDITINDQTATLITKDYYQIVVPIVEKNQLLHVAYWSESGLPAKEEFIRIVENITLN